MYETTSDISIYKKKIRVFKDENGIYPQGCIQYVTCQGIQKEGKAFNMVMDIEDPGPNSCNQRVYPGQEVTFANVSNIKNVQGIQVPNRGLLYINPADLTVLINCASGCCGS